MFLQWFRGGIKVAYSVTGFSGAGQSPEGPHQHQFCS